MSSGLRPSLTLLNSMKQRMLTLQKLKLCWIHHLIQRVEVKSEKKEAYCNFNCLSPSFFHLLYYFMPSSPTASLPFLSLRGRHLWPLGSPPTAGVPTGLSRTLPWTGCEDSSKNQSKFE